MTTSQRGQTVQGIDYSQAFRFTQIFRSFKIATQPGKITLAIAMVVVMFVVGWLLDGLIGGGRVIPGEFQQFTSTSDVEQFKTWRESQRKELRDRLAWFLQSKAGITRDQAQEIAFGSSPWRGAKDAFADYIKLQRDDVTQRYGSDKEMLESRLALIDMQEAAGLDAIDQLTPRGVFHELLEIKINAFRNLVDSAVSLRFGWDQINPRTPLDTNTVFGAIRSVAFEMPCWLAHAHTLFLAIWLFAFLAIWSLMGGALSRSAVVEAAGSDPPSLGDSVGFAFRRWLTYAFAPLIPMVIIAIVMLIVALYELLFHVPILDIVGSVLFVIAVPLGFVMAFFLVIYLGAVHLMYPAISAEGTDAFDSLSRAYSYVLARPWRFCWYTFVALVYGAISYLFVGVFIFTALYLVQSAASVFASPFADVFPRPELGDLRYDIDFSELAWSAKIAAIVIRVWVTLTIFLVAAYAVSFYFSSFSIIYLLLRRHCDGTDASQVFIDTAADQSAAEAAAPSPPAAEPADDQ